MEDSIVNVGLRLAETARLDPDGVAVVEPAGRGADGKRQYNQVSFRELEDDSNLLADGLRQMGMPRGARIVLMVRPSIDFISLVFAMFKAGGVTVLIDPGMQRNVIGQYRTANGYRLNQRSDQEEYSGA